ncbi:MAG: PKD domain-containing protein [Bacteroidetes bacterium]|nr:PKD domain-containing protein [Bacteroidota bacterium]
MKKVLFTAFALGVFFAYAQNHNPITTADSLEGYSMEEFNHHMQNFRGTETQKQNFLKRSQRAFIDRKYKLGVYAPPVISNNTRGTAPAPDAMNCVNIGFESGNTSNWTVTGDNAIVSGGTDGFGGYNKVYAGSYSLMLSSNNLSTTNFQSSASRVISVPSTGTTFFNLYFALDILDYPHTQAAAAKFTVTFFNASGTALPCPQYNCYYYQNSAGAGTAVGISSFQQTPGSPGVNLGGAAYPVTYCNWQTVASDLSAYGGQNVTCKIECDWCIYNYDWAYCYIDADCPTSATTLPTCSTLPFSLCGPGGMTTYSWTPPAGNSPSTANTMCINAAVAGNYTLNTTLNTCSLVAYTFTYNVQAGPTPNFTDSPTPCSGNVSFGSTSTPNGSAPITSYTWNWGDGTAAGSGINTTHTYAGAGTNTVTLVISNGSCIDSVSKTVTIPAHPIPSFTATNACFGIPITYTSTSTASAGIASQTWHFGDGAAGTGINASHAYTAAQTYNATLIVKDNNGCTDSITNPVTVYPLPTVTVNSSTICLGQQTATLTANGASTYAWSPATGLSAATGASVTGNPAATTFYIITGTGANTCTNTATATITVSAPPTITVNSPTICVGQQTATLTANGASTYAWAPAATLSGSTGTTVTGTPATTTNYTVTGTTASGCSSTGTTTITVNALPLPVAMSNTPCLNQPLTFSCTPGGLANYVWTGPNSYAATGATPTQSVSTAGSAGVYTVVVTDNQMPACVNYTTVTVSIYPLPVITATTTPVCTNQTIQLSASGGVSYQWSGPGSPAFSSTLQNPQIPNAVVSEDGNYSVLAVDAHGCKSGNVARVLVYPLPIISVNTATICLGQQTATLTANGASTYVWSPASGLSSSIGTSVYGDPSVASNYTVTGTDTNGCVSTATTSVFVNQLPIVSMASVTPGCVPLCTSVGVSSTPPANSYSCTFGNGQSISPTSLAAASSFSLSTCYNSAGSFPIRVTVTDINSCISSASTIVLAYPIPKADFVYQPNPVSILNPEVSFLNQSVGQITNYSWSFGDGGSASVLSPAHTYADTGTYQVTLIVVSAQGCTDTTIRPLVVQNDYALYVPNAFTPNGDGKNDVFAAVGDGVKTFGLSIYDRWGNLLYYTSSMNVGWNGTMQNKGGDVLQEDVYVWKIDAVDFSNKSRSLSGTVTLIK